MKKTIGSLLFAGLAGFLGACTSTSTPTTPSSSTDYTSAARFFSGVLEPAGTSGALTFTTLVSDTISVSLVSLTDGAGAPVPDQLTLNVGTVSGADCVPTSTSKVVGTTLTAAVTVSLPAGVYCVSLADLGQLTAPRNFTIRVVTSSGTAPAGTEGTDQMPSSLAVRGASAKTFTATAQGTVSLTLTAVDGDVVLPVELALGVWDGDACRVNASVVVVGGTDPQIARLVDAGTYCVRLADVGYLTHKVTITGTMQHP